MTSKRYLYIITAVALLFPFLCNSQKRNNVIFDLGVVSLIPKIDKVILNHESMYPDDLTYHLNYYPQFGLGFKSAVGYEIRLKSFKTSTLKATALLNYRMLQEKNKQSGEYYGGISGKYFAGNRELSIKKNVISLSWGLNYTFQEGNQDEWTFDCFVSGNIDVYTTVHEIEVPVNCQYCNSKNSKYSFKDFDFHYSFDLKLARLFRLEKISLGPFLAYNFNKFYDPHYKITGIIPGFGNSTYDLKYYHLLETGLKIKLL